MKQKITRLFHSLSTKIILIIIVLIFPLNLIAIAATNIMTEYLVDQVRMSNQNLADVYMTEIEGRMKNVQNLLNYFLNTDSDCIMMLGQSEKDYPYQSAKMKMYYKLKYMAEMTDGGNGYFYYSKKVDDLLLYTEATGTPDAVEVLKTDVRNMIEEGTNIGWHIHQWESGRSLVLFIKQGSTIYGGWLKLDALEKRIISGIDRSGASVSFTEEDAGAAGSGLIQAYSIKKNICLNITEERAEVLGSLSIFQKGLDIVAAIYLMLIPVLYLFLQYLLLEPLRTINHAHRQLQSGDGEFRIGERANSIEYDEAFQSFNKMADRIKTLKIEGYEKELSKQKMELKNLQLQIRPHFLLNTFNLLYALAQRQEMEAIKRIILYLSKYFRYIFRNEKELELFSKELELLQGYIEMAALRYSGKIVFLSDVDPEIYFVRVPPLLIHNFVENSVKHGIRKDEVLHISLTGRYSNRMVTFTVEDDGNGMDQDMLEKERALIRGEMEPEDPNAHIGILNSLKRLKYFYGECAEVEIESTKDEMTRFIIRFPYDLEVEDEIIDCE